MPAFGTNVVRSENAPVPASVGGVVAQRPNVAPAVIGENVSAGQLRQDGSSINDAADDAVALVDRSAVLIILDGIDECLTDGRAGFVTGVKALAVGPAIVAALHHHVHLFPGVLTHVAAIQPTRNRVEGESPRIAKANCVEFSADIIGINCRAI